MGALLEIREPDAEPRQFLAEDGMTFGRSQENHCVLADPTVGTHHFRVVSVQSRLEIEDLGSRNSTAIGGAGLLKKGERRELVPGLVFRAGKTVFAVKSIEEAAGSSGAEAECRATARIDSFRMLVSEAATKGEAPAGVSAVPSPAPAPPAAPPSSGGGAGDGGAVRPPRAPASPGTSVKEASLPPADIRAALEKLRPRLVVACSGLQRITDLREPMVTIGRGESADVRINHPHVASEHARISFDGREFTLESLDGQRETSVAGETLTPGSRRVLSSETPVVFGSVDTLFVADEEGSDHAPHQRAARSLLASRKVSSFDFKEAVRQAAAEGRHVGEMLLRDSDLRVADWCEAIERASRGGGAGGRSWLAPVVVGALVVVAALVYLFLFVF